MRFLHLNYLLNYILLLIQILIGERNEKIFINSIYNRIILMSFVGVSSGTSLHIDPGTNLSGYITDGWSGRGVTLFRFPDV